MQNNFAEKHKVVEINVLLMKLDKNYQYKYYESKAAQYKAVII